MADTVTPDTSVATETIPATTAAVISGKTSEYRDARRAERAGKPLAAVPVATSAVSDPTPSAPAAPVPETRQLSHRQQQINERAQKAVDSATAALREENARLKADLARATVPRGTPPAAPAPAPIAAQPPPTAVQTEPDWKRYTHLDGAPKLADFDTIEEFNAAQFVFFRDQDTRESLHRAEAEATTAAQRVRIDKFLGQLTDARTADPDFAAKLSDTVKHHVKPFAALRPGEAAGPMNIIGEYVYDSPIAPKVLMELSQHPDVLERLVAVPAHLTAWPAGPARAKAHIEWMVKEYGKLEGRLETPPAPAAAPQPPPKTLTDVPATVTQLGSRAGEAADPKAAAVRKGDTRAYREIRRQERAAGRF